MTSIKISAVEMFGDESGNDGMISKKQPIFTYALIPLTSEQRTRTKEHLRLIREKDKLPERFEFHHVDMASSSAGARRIRAIGEFFLSNDIPIFLCVVEKKYMVCALIVESYLDPVFNSTAPPEDAHELRRWIASLLYEILDNTFLGLFYDAVKKDSVVQMMKLGEVLAARVSMHPDAQVSRMGRAFRKGATAFFRPGQKTCSEPRCTERMSPMTISFLPFLYQIDSFLADRCLKAALVFDKDSQFGHAKDHILNFGRTPGTHLATLEEFGAPGLLKNIYSFAEENSRDFDEIQLADIAAGVAGRIVSERLYKPRLDKRLLDVWEPFQIAIARTENHYLAASSRMLEKNLLSP